jgi:hypothetical protein
MESFKFFEASFETTPNEIFHLIEAVCPGFPKSIVVEASTLTLTNVNHLVQLLETKCNFRPLFRNIAFLILYDEWLKIIEEFFRNDGKGMFLSSSKLKTKLEEYSRNLPLSIYQPPLQAIQAAIEVELSTSHSRSYDKEISYDNFKKNLFSNAMVLNELERISSFPQFC